MTLPSATIEAVFVGQPQEITDNRGVWRSSIRRGRVPGPVTVTHEGIVGDRVTQPYHGGPGAALCVHLADHYDFWKRAYGMHLPAGSVGENVTLRGITEHQIFAGDIVRLGTARVQVSGPRVPCANQARHIGRPDWIRLTILENRTGFYLRVLEPGAIQEGDAWTLEERLNENASIPALNRCMYLAFDAEFARQILAMNGLDPWWKQQINEKLESQSEHWTETMAGSD